MPGFRTATVPEQDVDIRVRGPVTLPDLACVRHAVAEARWRESGAGHLRIKLAGYRGGDRRAVSAAQVNAELCGRMVRAQATAGTVADAVRLALSRLDPRVRRLRQRLAGCEAGRPCFIGEPWELRARHVIPPALRVGGNARRVARHKTCPPAVQDLGAAALTMDLRDYDFHLFTDESSGQNAVVTRADCAGFRVVADQPRLLGAATEGVPVAGPPLCLPAHTLPEAVRALAASGAPFLPFTGVGSGRAAVLYQRFDGHLGLLTSLG
ncbi:hypothetical protein Asp14428_07800 [Actinoplanes sp. NBRC 14428]|uniref:Sigma 54 modulation/S30EA-like ribosomal protein n=1 Tax=Pseudosporangium ferrugineum TaxID=439699 RepID=A0A2T0RKD4_9ACTN|nr:sigma 54 modulation/S30EA ribosomal C-terminal domain-containing protein [Pseudosporangium ferrugineum]PRY21618.1 sigma 54 modulation/S30EA-like ribosomal protein [Pseudosporangium ferrugineum]BCJ49305.1 hypothetical protein Asp14428_07800 [Actinoplanes sp. NBRC 14428]